MLRGGSLLTSILSSLPVWQDVAPRLVLEAFEAFEAFEEGLDSDGIPPLRSH